MPQKLAERAEKTLRDFFEATLRPSRIVGYDPDQTWTPGNEPDDALVITTNWDNYGDYYPVIVVNQTDGPTVPNSGNTTYNGQQGDGSGPNQYEIKPVTVSCQAVEGQTYLNDTPPQELARRLYQECHAQIQTTASVSNELLFTGMTPPTPTKSNEAQNGDSTDTWYQYQGTARVGVLNTP